MSKNLSWMILIVALPMLLVATLVHSARFDRDEAVVHFRFGWPCDSVYVMWVEADYVKVTWFNKIGAMYCADCYPTGVYVTEIK